MNKASFTIFFFLNILVCNLTSANDPGNTCVTNPSLLNSKVSNIEDIINDMNSKYGNHCIGFEKKFREQVISELKASIENYNILKTCLNSESKSSNHECNTGRKAEVDSLISNLNSYRNLSEKLHRNIALKWIEDLPAGHKEFAQNCFLGTSSMRTNSDGSIQRTKGIEFDSHLRTLKVQKKPESQCIGIKNKWIAELTNLINNAKENPSSVNMSVSDMNNIKRFEYSFANKLLSDRTKNNPNIGPIELKQSLYFDMQRMIIGLKDFDQKISNLKDKELYKLYDFENQFTIFQSSLTENEKSLASECKDNTSYLKDCFTSGNVEGRCTSRNWGIAKELVPVYGMIDAMAGYADVKAAEGAGVLTTEEARQQNNQLTMQFIFSIPIGAVVGTSANVGAKIIARNSDEIISKASRFIADESGALTIPGKLGGTLTVNSNKDLVAETIEGIVGNSKFGSCAATCDTFIKKVFTKTRSDDVPLRLDMYRVGSQHYHIRTPAGDIIDPTLDQFFNYADDHVANVFFGSKDDLIREIGRLRVEVGFKDRINKYFSERSNEELYEMLYGAARLHKSGETLKYFDEIGETLYD